ncbi:MAG: linear amide C-N hydrolase [Xanthomonadales bacterium]|nr:linear amide C-N hydrolase [Xanthomonadales bacterium]
MFRTLLITSLVICLTLSPISVYACSTFVVRTGQGTLFGRNTDGDSVPGQLVVNKRGVHKQSLPWGFAGPSFSTDEKASWISRYGSLTFTHFGREFPDGGVNEAGLIVEEMTLGDTEYAKSDSAPTVSVQQWIQYQLDKHATVKEVLEGIADFNLRGWPWHFMIADREGQCAIVEFHDGSPQIGRGTMQNGCVLTNDRLTTSTEQLKLSRSVAPPKGLTEGSGSIARFIRINNMLADAVPASFPERRDYAFEVLTDVAQGDSTFRTIVYDLGAMKVYFRSVQHPEIKEISLGGLDFSAETPALTLDIETSGPGDVTSSFRNYDAKTNQQIVEGAYRLVRTIPSASSALDQELTDAGVSESEFIEAIANYPATTYTARPQN